MAVFIGIAFVSTAGCTRKETQSACKVLFSTEPSGVALPRRLVLHPETEFALLSTAAKSAWAARGASPRRGAGASRGACRRCCAPCGRRCSRQTRRPSRWRGAGPRWATASCAASPSGSGTCSGCGSTRRSSGSSRGRPPRPARS